MSHYSPTGAPTGRPMAAPPFSPTGGSALPPPQWLLEQAGNAAALRFLNGQPNGTLGFGAGPAAAYASAYAVGYAQAAASYGLDYETALNAAYQAAYAAITNADGQAQADFNAGYYPKAPNAPAGYGFYGDSTHQAQVPIEVAPTEPAPSLAAASATLPNLDVPSLGVPGTTGASESEASAPTDQAPVLAPPNTLTLADQCAAVGRHRPPVTGGGVAVTLRKQMKKFQKRRRA